jgi:formiminotetrahydrofolate cyclodeaminase
LPGFRARRNRRQRTWNRSAMLWRNFIPLRALWPPLTPEEQGRRESTIQNALQGAAGVPMEVARKAAVVFDLLVKLEKIASPSMLSDIRVGRLMAGAAVQGALENVAINLQSITDSAFSTRLRSESELLAARIGKTSPR